MTIAHNLGFPPLGAHRELKRATEGYWSGKVPQAALLQTGAELRAAHWRLQRDAGVDLIPSNDFSYYDRVLDACAMVGAVPTRYGWSGGSFDLDTYFAMARGVQSGGRDVTAMEMTKWFDTNYHYIVPEFEPGQTFRLASTKVVDEFTEAKALGFHTKPVLIGPVTFLLLGKTRAGRVDRLDLVDALLPVYADVLGRLDAAGATWGQIDEPCLALDRTPAERAAYVRAYRFLADRAHGLKLLVTTYFAGLDDNLATARELPVAGLHVDLVRAGGGQLDQLLKAWPKGRVLSLGVIDGRNIWRADLATALGQLERARERIGADDLWVAPSCSLLHVPVDLDLEHRLDAQLKSWLAFATQKLVEVATLARAIRDGRAAVAAELEANARLIAGRRSSRRIHEPAVKQRAAGVSEKDMRRASPHATRRKRQLRLPLFPTTTIGSFPQTAEVRAARKQLHDGKLTPQEYDAFIADQITRTLRIQAELGLDVLVHGEFERNDMVEYFGEQLEGFAFTEHGWVQSYGTRYVKPPVRLHPAVVRDALREAAHHLRRRVPAQGDDGALEHLRPVQDGPPGEGHADRPGDHPAVVVRARRSAARRDGEAAGAGDPRRGQGPRSGRDPGDPDRRAGAARRPAATARGLGRVRRVGGERLPARHRGRVGRDPDPHAHVLQRVQRRDPGDREIGRAHV